MNLLFIRAMRVIYGRGKYSGIIKNTTLTFYLIAEKCFCKKILQCNLGPNNIRSVAWCQRHWCLLLFLRQHQHIWRLCSCLF